MIPRRLHRRTKQRDDTRQGEGVPPRARPRAARPRRQPQAQRDALRGVLEQVGVADALIAYHSERNGGRLTVVDGHLHKHDYDLEWPTLIIDVTDAEADQILASLDPLAAQAEYKKPKVYALLQEVRARSPAVLAMLKDLAKKAGAGRQDQEKLAVSQETFEVLVECVDEGHERQVYDRLTGDGLPCRVLTF